MIQTDDSVEILPLEGESGLEAVGFTQRNDVTRTRARPTNTIFWFNRTNFAAQATAGQPPVAYWGHFMTLFDGWMDREHAGRPPGPALKVLWQTGSARWFPPPGKPFHLPTPPTRWEQKEGWWESTFSSGRPPPT